MSNWTDNRIQYPRLIAEASMAGAFTKKIIKDMAISMNLDNGDVLEVIERAVTEYGKIVRSK